MSPDLLQRVFVPMRDGARLSGNLRLPAANGRFPVILEYTPYRKDNSPDPGARARRFLEQGYALAQVEIRGTGDSEGHTDTFSDPQQIADGVEVVPWLAWQAWCDGNVGMTGLSYPGLVCWQVAMHRPAPLKAIVVYHCMLDLYSAYACPGGCPRAFPFEQTMPLMTGYNVLPPNPAIVGNDWLDHWQHRLDHTAPWGLAHVANLVDGPYWRERSLPPDYERIQCATFLISGWADWYHDDFLRAFPKLRCPKRVLIGPWGHTYPAEGLPLPRVDDVREALRWSDEHLKGDTTGVKTEPPITLFIREFSQPDIVRLEAPGEFRAENEWPLARARDHVLPLPEGRLEYDPTVGAAAGRSVIGQLWPIWGTPLDQRADEAHSLVSTGEPLIADTEITGHPRTVLRISSTAEVAYFCVKLCDVAPDGTSALVAKGGLDATHRESHVAPQPLEPGQVYELAFDLQAVAYRFRAGHRLRVMIACADFPNVWPTPRAAQNTIHPGSRLILPTIPAQTPTLPASGLQLVTGPAPRRDELPAPEDLSITRDLVSDTLTASYRHRAGCGVNTAKCTVSRTRPARAVVDATFEAQQPTPAGPALVKATCVTSSDERAFHHEVRLTITLNGALHHERNWQRSVPRPGC